MIILKPSNLPKVQCKVCKSDGLENQILFQGIHVLQDCTCPNCRIDFYQTLPIGHDMHFPIQFSKNGEKSFYDPKVKEWHVDPLINSLKFQSKEGVEIKRKVIKSVKRVIILNCLDSCFGHFLYKIYNAPSIIEKYPEAGLIILLPSKFEWLVPEGTAEIWSVNLSLNQCKTFIQGLDEFVKEKFKDYDEVLLSQSPYLNPYKYFRINHLIKSQSFDLAKFKEHPLTVTFVLREDRFWHNSRLFDFLYKVSIKLNLMSFFQPVLIWKQNRLVGQTIKKMIKEFPSITFYATGIGNTGKLHEKINDLRFKSISLENELAWMDIYSKSHLVIGVHGSNMIIPTSLAAGFLDLIPRYKLPNFGEDTLLPFYPRLFEFLGRYLDEYSSPKLLVLHAKSIIHGFDFRYKNENQLPE